MGNYREATVVARWWADFMRNDFSQNAGSEDESARAVTQSANQMAGLLPPLPAEKIIAFEKALEAGVNKLIQKSVDKGTWKEENPRWGSAFRTIATDYGPEPILREALDAAGIRSGMYLPIKTVSWVDPGLVTASAGYGAGIEVVWASVKCYDAFRDGDFLCRTLQSEPIAISLEGAVENSEIRALIRACERLGIDIVDREA